MLLIFVENIAIKPLASVSDPLLKSETVHLKVSVLTIVTTSVVSPSRMVCIECVHSHRNNSCISSARL